MDALNDYKLFVICFTQTLYFYLLPPENKLCLTCDHVWQEIEHSNLKKHERFS